MNPSNNTWFYDELAVLFQKKEQEDQARIRKLQRQADAHGGVGKPFVFRNVNELFGDVIEIPFRSSDRYKPYAEMDLEGFAGAMQFRLNFARAHPFLVGPATLESLLDRPAENYDFIRQGRLPFNPLFFEFTEAPSGFIPGIKRSNVNLKGVYLCASPSKESGNLTYVFSSFWKDKEGEILGVDLFMDDPKSTNFKGHVSHLSQSNFELDKTTVDKNAYKFVVDMNKGKVHISQTPKKLAALLNHEHNAPTELVDFSKLFDRPVPYNPDEHTVFSMVPNLCTNLVNYVNAHNVTITTKSRQSPSEPSEEGSPNSRPYSIVTVKDETHHEPITHHQGRVLTYQLAIRGHNRRLRNSEGEVVKTSWIPSYIKGPEGAPFYDTRHEVTAKKILAERALYARA